MLSSERRVQAAIVVATTLVLFILGTQLGDKETKDLSETAFKAIGFVYAVIAFTAFVLTGACVAVGWEKTKRPVEAIAGVFGIASAMMYAYAELEPDHEDAMFLWSGIGIVGLLVFVGISAAVRD